MEAGTPEEAGAAARVQGWWLRPGGGSGAAGAPWGWQLRTLVALIRRSEGQKSRAIMQF